VRSSLICCLGTENLRGGEQGPGRSLQPYDMESMPRGATGFVVRETGPADKVVLVGLRLQEPECKNGRHAVAPFCWTRRAQMGRAVIGIGVDEVFYVSYREGGGGGKESSLSWAWAICYGGWAWFPGGPASPSPPDQRLRVNQLVTQSCVLTTHVGVFVEGSGGVTVSGVHRLGGGSRDSHGRPQKKGERRG